MRSIAISGQSGLAIAAAAAVAAAARAQGLGVVTQAATPVDASAPEHEFVASHGAQWRSELALLEWATGTVLAHADRPCHADLAVIAGQAPIAQGEADITLDAEAIALFWDGAAPLLAEPLPALGLAAAAAVVPAREALSIGVVGDALRHLRHYPAVMLSLAAACERHGFAVMPRFVPATLMLEQGLPPGLDGVILPGGPVMGQVAAQVIAANAAYAQDLPLLGLCLGMQSMTTAAMRRGGAHEASPEEVEPACAQRSFTLMHDAAGAVRHRLGDTTLSPLSGTRLAALSPPGTQVRMHHRYGLNDVLLPAFEAGGLIVSARSADGVAEAVEALGQRFHLGLQGHPELGVDPGLRGIWDGFVAAAAQTRAAQTRAVQALAVQIRRADHTPGRTEDATITP